MTSVTLAGCSNHSAEYKRTHGELDRLTGSSVLGEQFVQKNSVKRSRSPRVLSAQLFKHPLS